MHFAQSISHNPSPKGLSSWCPWCPCRRHFIPGSCSKYGSMESPDHPRCVWTLWGVAKEIQGHNLVGPAAQRRVKLGWLVTHRIRMYGIYANIGGILMLVGGWATPLKNMSSSIGMMTFPIYGKIKNGNQTTNQYTIHRSCGRWNLGDENSTHFQKICLTISKFESHLELETQVRRSRVWQNDISFQFIWEYFRDGFWLPKIRFKHFKPWTSITISWQCKRKPKADNFSAQKRFTKSFTPLVRKLATMTPGTAH